MKLLIDMNLSPRWADALRESGLTVVHWTAVGDPRARDDAIMEWARSHDHVVLTHDLDFGALLALGHLAGPSVILLRTQDVNSKQLMGTVAGVVARHREQLVAGAIITVDEAHTRVRVLPLHR